MREIKRVSDSIKKNIAMAREDALTAIELKETFPSIAEAYYKSANSKLNDITNYHTVVVGVINDYKKDNGDVPERMKFVYDILHKENIENVAAIKDILALYKGN